jgi:chemotaxis regulatin CheY-phosphate phosphatase CheZ
MYAPFESLPDTSKIWIYLSSKEFSETEVSDLSEKLEHFCSKWTRHGEDLKASFTIKYNRFIVLAVDESYNEISGCAINKSIKLMQKIEQEFDLDLMNRLQTAFQKDNQLQVTDLNTFKQYAASGKVNAQTTVYNNLATTKAAFKKQWEVPASESWHARFLN